ITAFSQARLGRQDAEYAIRVSYGRDLRVGDHEGIISKVGCHEGTGFNAGGGITNNVFKAHFLELVQYLFDPFPRQRILVAGLRRRQDEQVFQLLVANQCLVQGGFPLDDIDEIVDNPALASHDEIEVAQADVKVHHDGFMAPLGQTGREACATGGFSDTTLTGCHHNNTCHDRFIPICWFAPLWYSKMPIACVTGRYWTELDSTSSCRGAQCLDLQRVSLALYQCRSIAQGRVKRSFDDTVNARNGQELGIELGGEDTCVFVPLGAGHGFSPQGSVDMDVAIGDDFGPLADHANDDKIGSAGIDTLSGAQGPVDDHGRGRGRWFSCVAVRRL